MQSQSRTHPERHAPPLLGPGDDRDDQQRTVLGNLTLRYMVLSRETDGALLVVENISQGPGGPPRHVHHAQEEWFYAVAGEFTVEIGGALHRLTPGASILAPRRIAHAWAHVGAGAGRLLIVFQPAGKMEAFGEFGQLGCLSRAGCGRANV